MGRSHRKTDGKKRVAFHPSHSLLKSQPCSQQQILPIKMANPPPPPGFAKPPTSGTPTSSVGRTSPTRNSRANTASRDTTFALRRRISRTHLLLATVTFQSQ